MDGRPSYLRDLAPKGAFLVIADCDMDHDPNRRSAKIWPLPTNVRHPVFQEYRSDCCHHRFVCACNIHGTLDYTMFALLTGSRWGGFGRAAGPSRTLPSGVVGGVGGGCTAPTPPTTPKC